MSAVASIPRQTSFERKLQALIRLVLEKRLGKYGYEHADIIFGTDADGDPAILVNVKYRLSERPIDPRATLEAGLELRQKLMKEGEDRVPIVRHHLDEKQKVKRA